MKQLLFILCLALSSFCVRASDTATVSVQYGSGNHYAPINVIDHVTGSILSGATVTNVVVQNNNAEIATVEQNPTFASGLKLAPVAVGSGSAIVNCHVTYTDPGDGLQKSEDRSITILYTVVGSPHGVKLGVSFN